MELNNSRRNLVNTESMSRSESVGLGDLQTEFLSLRIGEVIPRLEIKEIRKLSHSSKTDNLPSVDYKYLIEARDGKVLTVSSWTLWKKIAAALKDAGTIEAVLELKHLGREDYSVRVLSKSAK